MGSPSYDSVMRAMRRAIEATPSLMGKIDAASKVVGIAQKFLGGRKKPTPAARPPRPGREEKPRAEPVDLLARARPRNAPDPLMSGQMIGVTSSNVHSIGFQADDVEQPRAGTLLIRYLGGQGSRRSGPGPLYGYHEVPVELFRDLRAAASKGRFVWDDLRVRGTISGHHYSYELLDIEGNNVPRQAGLKRGEDGEYYLRRSFMRDGRLLRSELPERKVRNSGPNGEANRGAPNRGTPKRGAPRTGRP